MRVACGFDHAGVGLKDVVTHAVIEAGHEAVYLGETDDYPEIALAVAAAVIQGRSERGVRVCGSGAGVAVAATKVAEIERHGLGARLSGHSERPRVAETGR